MYYEIQHKRTEYHEAFGKHVNPIYIFDSSLSSKHPIAICYDVAVAETIIYKCNNK